MNAIFQRRSIRKYTAETITEEQIQRLLDAAMSAPSARNQRPWEFVVITEPEKLQSAGDVSPYAQMTKTAPLAILVCGNLQREPQQDGFWVQDCAAATENLLLEAVELGLGGVWLGIYPVQPRCSYLQALFGLPEHIVPFALIPIGHPAEIKNTGSRYDATRVHRNAW